MECKILIITSSYPNYHYSISICMTSMAHDIEKVVDMGENFPKIRELLEKVEVTYYECCI